MLAWPRRPTRLESKLTGRHKIATIDLFVLPTICFKLLHGLVIPKTDDDLEVQICPAAEAANE